MARRTVDVTQVDHENLEDVSGLMYEPWRTAARVIARTDVNYLACARKPEAVGA